MRSYHIGCAVLLLFISKLHAQDGHNQNPRSEFKNWLLNASNADTSAFLPNKFWVTYCGGPSLCTDYDGLDLLIWGPGLEFNRITKDAHFFKIKVAARIGVLIFESLRQRSFEADLMTGKLKHAGKKDFHIFSYGIGIIAGIKRGDLLYPNAPTGGGGFLSIDFSSSLRKKDPFIFFCLPLQYQYQVNWFGLGLDANINPYLPYLGFKMFLSVGQKFLR